MNRNLTHIHSIITMAQLNAILKNIHKIKTIEKITNALRLTSVVLFKKFEPTLKKSIVLQNELAFLAKQILISHKNTPSLQPVFTPQKILLILISQSRSQNGSFYSTLASYLDIETNFTNNNHYEIITIGGKINKWVEKIAEKKSCIRIIKQYPEIKSSTLELIALDATKILYSENYANASIYCNWFSSFFFYYPKKITLIPIKTAMLEHEEAERIGEQLAISPPSYIYEQPIDSYLNPIKKNYHFLTIYNALLSSFVAENAARITSMDGATKNAKTVGRALKTKYNKLRQSLITAEINELSSTD